MHGDKVAYGVLVQLVAEGKEAEARQLLAYYDSVGLPHSWKQMNLARIREMSGEMTIVMPWSSSAGIW